MLALKNTKDITLVYIVCREDLPNLYLSLCSIKQNWVGNKKILIIEDNQTNKVNSLEVVKSINFNHTWDIKILQGDRLTLEFGWDRQQIYKLTSQLHTTTSWSIILDCKNMLIKPESGNSFINETTVYVPGLNIKITQTNEWGEQSRVYSKSLVNGVDTNIKPFTLTPFVFNRELTNELNSKFNYNELTELKFTEFYLYWYYTNTKLPYTAHYVNSGAYAENINIDIPEETIILNIHRRHAKNKQLIQQLTNILLEKSVVNAQQVGNYYTLLDRFCI